MFVPVIMFVLAATVGTVPAKHHHAKDIKDSRKLEEADWWNSLEERKWPDSTSLPEHIVFLSENSTIVTAQTGSTPILHCEIEGVMETLVSWIRRKDYHLLTIGLATYSSDDRFFTTHVRNEQDWALHIKYAQPSDEGLYECQVSTHPPSSLFVTLHLVEARAEIVGGPDKIINSGSTLRLTCLLRQTTEPPAFVFWYHDDRMINYDSGRGVSVSQGRHHSELSLSPAHPGNYTCAPSNARPASINVHILDGEQPAAMQHERTSLSTVISPSAIWITLMHIVMDTR
ncbi:zwei Ig domain protein zig-8-like [Lycorma delicatula]|uniref:zwei Ig domain protein zig-8-like n=1 Tax=Lycorma delicatula TaxID=130591 RepID=UPI003F514707